MPNLKDLKKRIRTIKNTSKTTKAMKLVSASKLRKSKELIDLTLPFFSELVHLIPSLEFDETFEEEGLKKELLIVIGADKGLCGSYNSGVIKKLQNIIKNSEDPENIDLMVVGKKVNDVLKYKKIKVEYSFNQFWKAKINYEYIHNFIEKNILSKMESKVYKKITLVFTVFKSALSIKPYEIVLFPQTKEISSLLEEILSLMKKDKLLVHPKPVELETNKDQYQQHLKVLLRNSIIYFAFLNSQASEHGSRMAAMDNATRNAKEMIDQLTLTYNRLRQEAITKDLIDIIGGAQAAV